MKTLVIIALLLLSISAGAQNYECLQFGPKNYFINGAGDVRGIRIDSSYAVGGDIIFYPYRTQRVNNYLFGFKPYDSLGGSWLGKNVIKHADGTFVFDNLWDTVIIKSQAHIGDSWTFFNDTTPYYYTATVVSKDTMTVLGALDSIKRINITADSSGVVNTADPVNNFQIILSKNNGFVQVFDLFTFPYRMPNPTTFHPRYGSFDFYLDVLLNNLEDGDGGWANHPPNPTNSVFHLFAFHTPTNMEIYGFDAGDVYETHFSAWDNDPLGYDTYISDSIFTKTVTPYSVIYSGTEHKMTIMTDYTAHPPAVTYAYESHPFYKNSDTNFLVSPYYMPEETNEGYILHYYPHLSAGGASCDSPAAYIFLSYFGFGLYGTAIIPSIDSSTYSIGYGMSQKATFLAASQANRVQSYCYYYKNSIPCGGFVKADKADIISVNDNSIRILPNPANDRLEVLSDVMLSSNTIVSVYDMGGRLVLRSQAQQQKKMTVNTEAWNGGLYLIVIQDNTGIIKKEKIIIQR